MTGAFLVGLAAGTLCAAFGLGVVLLVREIAHRRSRERMLAARARASHGVANAMRTTL